MDAVTAPIAITMFLPKLTPVLVSGTASPCTLWILGCWAGLATSVRLMCNLYYILLLPMSTSLLLVVHIINIIITWPVITYYYSFVITLLLHYYYTLLCHSLLCNVTILLLHCYYIIITYYYIIHYYLLLHFLFLHCYYIIIIYYYIFIITYQHHACQPKLSLSSGAGACTSTVQQLMCASVGAGQRQHLPWLQTQSSPAV